MRRGKLLKLTSLALAGVMVLSGCGAKTSSETGDKGNTGADNGAIKFEKRVKNEGTPVENPSQPLTYGVISADPIKGQLNPIFYLDGTDAEVMSYTMLGAFQTGDLYEVKQDNEKSPIMYHLDREGKKFVLTINDKLKWSNGEDVTAEDIMATYHLFANPKYTDNIRYDNDYEAIVGLKEYHEGKADSISGMKKVNDKTVEFELSEVKPTMLWGDGTTLVEMLNHKQVEEVTDFSKFWEYPLNTKPLSYGPYYLEKNNDGESFLFKANPYYFMGEPKNKEFRVVTVPPAQLVEKLKSGAVDVISISSTQYEEVSKLTNGKILGVDDRYMGYIGFKLGKMNKETSTVEVNPNSKLADVNLRRALAMALDNDSANKSFFKGIGTTPTGSGLFPPIRKGIYNPDGAKIPFDVEGAKKLLDDNGYKDVDGDGLREDKNGNKLVIRMAQRNTGNEIDEPLANFYLQSFKNIGIDVRLTDDKLMGIKDFSQRVQADDENIDLFVGAWGLASSPNPYGLVGAKAPLNWYRYTSEKMEAAVEKLGSDIVFDHDKLIEAYREADKTIADELPFIPVRWTKALTFVNNRVGEYSVDPFEYSDLNITKFAFIDVLADTPIKSN